MRPVYRALQPMPLLPRRLLARGPQRRMRHCASGGGIPLFDQLYEGYRTLGRKLLGNVRNAPHQLFCAGTRHDDGAAKLKRHERR